MGTPSDSSPAPPEANGRPPAPWSLAYRPTLPPEDIPYDERKRSLRLVIAAWCFGTVFFNGISTAPLVGMFRMLGASAFSIGLLAAAPAVVTFFQPLASWWVERTGARKRFFLQVSYPGRLAWIPIVLIGWAFPKEPAALAAMLALVFVSRLSAAISHPAWFSWTSDLIPDGERGAFWATRQMWGSAFGTGAAIALGWFLGGEPPYAKFVAFFVLMAFFGWLDVYIHRGVTGVAMRRPPENAVPRFWSTVSGPLRDPTFRPIMIFTFFFSFACQLGGGMFHLMLLEEIDLTYFEISLYTPGIIGALTFASSRFWGRLMDNLREGERLVMAVCAVGVALIAVPYVFIGPRDHLQVAINVALSGIAWSGYQIAIIGLVIAYSPPSERASYVAVHAAVSGLANTLGALVAGAFAEAAAGMSTTWGPFIFTPLRTLYFLSGMSRLACLALLPMIREPGSRPIGVYVQQLFSMNPFERGTWLYVREKLRNAPARR